MVLGRKIERLNNILIQERLHGKRNVAFQCYFMCCFDEDIGDNDYKYFLLPVAECLLITEHFKISHAKKAQQKIQSGQSRTKISEMSIDFSMCLFVGDLCRSFDKHEFMTWVLIQEMYYKDSGERKKIDILMKKTGKI